MKSQSEHILELSRELLDDIEIGRLSAEKLLLKCSRLARLAGTDDIQKWISFEMQGYQDEDPVALKYMALTGRWVNYEKKQGYWGPLAQHEAAITAQQARIAAMQLPDIGGEWANVAINNVLTSMTAVTNVISALSGVRSRVLGLLHAFVSSVYYQREFESLAEGTFDRYKKGVDVLIAEGAERS